MLMDQGKFHTPISSCARGFPTSARESRCPISARNGGEHHRKMCLVHTTVPLKVHYYGTPVVLISPSNPPWDPLIMKFCDFFGNGQPLASSRLADGWRMPNSLGMTSHPTVLGSHAHLRSTNTTRQLSWDWRSPNSGWTQAGRSRTANGQR